MFSRLGKWLVVVALCFALGMHWTVLQSVAWVGMAVNFARSAPLKQALTKTFDGQHPCQICKFVAEGKRSEKQRDQLRGQVKLDLFVLQSAPFTHPDLPSRQLRPPAQLASARSLAPPTPPPRLA